MHHRKILFTPHCSQGPGSFPGLYDVRLWSYGASNLPNFRILDFVRATCAPSSALLVTSAFPHFTYMIYSQQAHQQVEEIRNESLGPIRVSYQQTPRIRSQGGNGSHPPRSGPILCTSRPHPPGAKKC